MGLRTRGALIAGLLVAADALATATLFPVPPPARQPSHAVLQRGAAERDYFWLKAAYPATPALPHYAQVFAGWLSCKPQRAGWHSFADEQNGLFFHQFTRQWISPDNRQAVSLLFQYTSSGSKQRSSPDSNDQFVALTRHRVPDAGAFFAQSTVECPRQ